MKKRPPEIKVPGKFDPQIRWLLVYFVATLLVLWLWQELFRQFAVQTIPYSEFKTYLSAARSHRSIHHTGRGRGPD